jgi:hypothetical protein
VLGSVSGSSILAARAGRPAGARSRLQPNVAGDE